MQFLLKCFPFVSNGRCCFVFLSRECCAAESAVCSPCVKNCLICNKAHVRMLFLGFKCLAPKISGFSGRITKLFLVSNFTSINLNKSQTYFECLVYVRYALVRESSKFFDKSLFVNCAYLVKQHF